MPEAPETSPCGSVSDEKELLDEISRTETLTNILAEDTEPTPTGATGAGQTTIEDAAANKVTQVPPTDAEVTNGISDGISGNKDGERVNSNATNGESTSDECKAVNLTSTPVRPAVGDDSAGSSPISTEGAKAGRPVPSYETPRRGSFEPPNPATGTQRRGQPCRAEFRPLSSSNKGRDASNPKTRGAQRPAAASGKRVQG
uniref:Uncharacterized protein n=1 Tax=Alexandrium andersonii TaxID=327968 RepID=A0A7S2NAB4_9DINO